MRTHLLLMFTLILVSCSSLKRTGSVDSFKEITFGSGGGFTGLVNTYKLNFEGKVYKMNADSPEELKRIKLKTLKGISKHLKKIDFEHIQSNAKGNMTYFIEVKTEDYQHRVTWSDEASEPVLKDFYSKLVETIKPAHHED